MSDYRDLTCTCITGGRGKQGGVMKHSYMKSLCAKCIETRDKSTDIRDRVFIHLDSMHLMILT